MSDTGVEGPILEGDAALAALVPGLGDEPRFESLLRGPDAVLLILDEAGTHLVHASAAAMPLARAIAKADGTVRPAFRPGLQIRATARPTLARIRFDGRGLATPTTCLVARRPLGDGRAVLVVVPVEPVPRLRIPGPVGPVGAVPFDTAPIPPAGVDEAAEAAVPEPGGIPRPTVPRSAVPRFTWTTDAVGNLVRVDGPAGGLLRDAILGRSWLALSQAGTARDAEGLLTVLEAGRTFRAIPFSINIAAPQRIVDLDLSGAPLARAGQAARGFAGFGIVRRTEAAPAAMSPLEAVAPEVFPNEVFPNELSPNDVLLNEVITREATAPKVVTPVSAVPSTVVEPGQRPTRAGEPAPEPSLTTHEHAAFREIARALGARFAGDDSDADAHGERAGPGGAVMPFPGAPPSTIEAASPDAVVVATLERLPMGVLVYRGEEALFANRTFLDFAGFSDLAALAAAGGIARLFRGLPPHERAARDAPAILTTRDGAHRGVDLRHSDIDWGGQRAELLLARDTAADEPARLRTAELIARDFAAHRAHEALGILDALDEGIVTLDGSARILGLNRSAASLFGTDPREVVGDSFLSLFAPESAVAVLGAAHGAPDRPASPPDETLDVVGRGPEGPLPLRLTVRPVAGMAEVRLCAILRPMPRREVRASDDPDPSVPEALRAAEMASVRKSEILAQVSHAIRTPMSGILGFADLLLTEPFGGLDQERSRSYLDDIRRSGTEILGLVDELGDFARIEAGRLDLAFTEIPLNDLVSRCVAQMQPEAARERIVVRTSFSTDLAPLVADEPSLRQAALTVIANAIRFTEAGGQVIVSTTMADRGEIALRVRDTGIGLTPDELDTLLRPFRAAPVPGVRPGGGTGLGLPITKALVEANHGEFRITSRKDEGTLVEMLFPPAQASRRA